MAVILLTASLTSAEMPFFDDFNRPDGIVGNGWTNWGDFVPDEGVAYLSNQHLRTSSGGVYRTIAVQPGQPVLFDFDFRPFDGQGAWVIQINTTNPSLVSIDEVDRLLFFSQQTTGGIPDTLRYKIGANLYDSSASSPYSRSYTTWAHVSGRIAGDLSATITIDYGDGGPAAVFSWASPGIVPLAVPQGGFLSLGTARHFPGDFDNFVVSPEPSTALLVGAASALVLRRRKRA
jgi:hypothetical protein